MMQIKLSNSKLIADLTEPYIIAEIGSNHNGDINLARKLIDSAKNCGCDAVKFQSWDTDSLISKEEYNKNQQYNDSPKKHFGSLYEMVEKYYLRPEQHKELKEYCDSVNIEFCSTPFSNKEADMLINLNVQFIKIASMDINNIEFLKYIAQYNKPILLSTGMASLSEIEKAIKSIENQGNNKIILLHCVAVYPPKLKDINLNNIIMLRKTFEYPVGFSDHTIGFSIPLASVALGVCLIEKHFTIDKTLPGWDHEISADPEEMKVIVNESKNIIKALGSYQRIVSNDEQKQKLKFRRSIVASKDLKKGDIITLSDLSAKRPGTGIAPDKVEYVIGRTLNRNIPKDELIRWEDFV